VRLGQIGCNTPPKKIKKNCIVDEALHVEREPLHIHPSVAMLHPNRPWVGLLNPSSYAVFPCSLVPRRPRWGRRAPSRRSGVWEYIVFLFFYPPPPPFLTTATVSLVPKQSPYPAQPEHGSERGIAREMSLVEKAWVVVVVDKHTRG